MVVPSARLLDSNRAMDLSLRTESEDGGDEADVDQRQEKYDAYGAMDLSSSCSSSLQGEEDREDVSRKRKAEDLPALQIKKDKLDDAGLDGDEEDSELVNINRGKDNVVAKARNKRRNIKQVLDQRLLHTHTKAAQEQENLRLTRLRENRKKVMEAYSSDYRKDKAESVSILLESSDEEDKTKGLITIPSSDSDECRIVSEPEEEPEPEDEDPNNSGMHVNDALNVRNPDGSVLVNLAHPPDDPDIFLAPQIAACVKPHQIGGLRFLYDNVVESVSRFHCSPGFGCILAHNMGLGKTMQIVSFTDLFLENTESKKVLCIVPINTIQNWVSEFNYWLPAQGTYSKISEKCEKVKNRDFKIHVLNDSLKNLSQRAAVISAWDKTGGVLLMGYELYRQLANRRQRRRRCKRGPQCVDIEEEDKNKKLLNDIQSALVNPGPDLVICDEGHRIKNSHASISQALKQIRTHRRVVLTGYPLQNNLMEYWCMVDFVRPNFLGNKTEFSNMFERPIQNGQCIDSTPKDVRLMKHRAHVLHEQLKGFVQRRGHVVLKESLPDKTEHVLFVRLTEIQRKLYRRFMEELISNRCVSNPLKAFAVCCKIWNHPDVLYNFLKRKEEIDIDFDPEELIDLKTKNGREDDDPSLISDGKKEEINYDWAQGMLNGYETENESHSNKLTIFLGLLEDTVLCDDRLLLFSQSLCTLNLIETFLQKRTLPNSQERWSAGVNYYRLDGSTSALERERLINGFNGDKNIKLFLVSTRAGSLGVNLVGANRVVIFDASWNPCHDTQAVCRVYRYGQTKETHVYRLVTDNSLEKKIYDRQVNKQGMSDRIVDELNPDAHLSSKEVHSLICEEESDPPPGDLLFQKPGYKDSVLNAVLRRYGSMLTKAPFSHESLLVDRKDNKLSKAEKKLAERAYKLEKTSKITYSRPSYAAFYPKQGTFATNLHNPGSNGFTRNRYYENGRKLDTWISPYAAANSSLRPVASVRPLKNDPREGGPPSPPSSWAQGSKSRPEDCKSTLIDTFPIPTFSNVLTSPPKSSTSVYSEWNKKCSSSVRGGEGSVIQHSAIRGKPGSASAAASQPKPGLSTNNVLEALSKQGVGIQQVIVPKDLVIPTNPNEPPIALRAGQSVMVIKTPKGVYLRMEEKIIKIKQQVTVNGLFGNLSCDREVGNGTDSASSVSESEIVKTSNG